MSRSLHCTYSTLHGRPHARSGLLQSLQQRRFHNDESLPRSRQLLMISGRRLDCGLLVNWRTNAMAHTSRPRHCESTCLRSSFSPPPSFSPHSTIIDHTAYFVSTFQLFRNVVRADRTTNASSFRQRRQQGHHTETLRSHRGATFPTSGTPHVQLNPCSCFSSPITASRTSTTVLSSSCRASLAPNSSVLLRRSLATSLPFSSSRCSFSSSSSSSSSPSSSSSSSRTSVPCSSSRSTPPRNTNGNTHQYPATHESRGERGADTTPNDLQVGPGPDPPNPHYPVPACWNCDQLFEVSNSNFCNACDIIQPPDEGLNHFELFGLPQSYEVNLMILEQSYRGLQNELHPDRFGQKSKKEQLFSTYHSSRLNEAYRTLKDPVGRAEYLLNILGVDIGETMGTVTDIELLEEIMDTQERVFDLGSGPGVLTKEEDVRELKSLDEKNTCDLQIVIAGLTKALNDNDLDDAKSAAIRLQYFAKIDRDIKKKLPVS